MSIDISGVFYLFKNDKKYFDNNFYCKKVHFIVNWKTLDNFDFFLGIKRNSEHFIGHTSSWFLKKSLFFMGVKSKLINWSTQWLMAD